MGLAAGVAVALAVLAVAVSAYLGTRSQLYSQIDQSLKNLAGPYIARANGPHGGPPGVLDGGGGPGQGIGTGGGQFRNTTNDGGTFGGDCDQGLGINGPANRPFGGTTGFVQLLTPNGTVCRSYGATSQIPVTAASRAVAKSGSGEYFTTMKANGNHIRVLITGIGGYGALMAAWPLTDLDHTLSNELLLLLVIAAAGIALAALFAYFVARTAVAPIARFTTQTERIAANPERLEHERLDVTGDDELARLARTFNATLDALELSVDAQRNLVADASHELRTPIATIRANLQLLRDEDRLAPEDREALRADMIEELDELTRLVSDVVELARGSKASGEPGDVRVDHVVAEAVERARRRAPGLVLEAEIEPTLVRGEGERVARAVANLLDNAAKWSPDGGLVDVELRGGILAVRDHGPGFQEQDLPYVFDRFHRARDARSKPGSGLGLAIVRQAADAHGGFAEASNAPGGGALLRVSFGPVQPIAGEVVEGSGAGGRLAQS
jgi:two-component system sensor histidine kinase MprB